MNDSPYGCTFFTYDAINGSLPGQLIPDMKSLGLTWLRYQLPWQYIEQHQGTYIWNALDSVVAACNSNNINICYVIQQSPLFYDQQPGNNTCAISGGGNTNSTSIVLNTVPTDLPPNTAVRLSGGPSKPEIILTSGYYSTGTNPVKLANPITGNNRTTMQWYLYPDPQSTKIFAQAVATRYNGQNGYGTIQAFEIGDEEYDSQNPNSSSNNIYNDRAATYYSNVLPVVAPAIRAVNPTALIGMCAIWWNQLPHAANFLSAIYQTSPTMKNNFDYVNFHYYPFESGSNDMVDVDRWCYAVQPQSTIPSFTQEWQALQRVMQANGDGNKDIRVTEFGWYTTNHRPGRTATSQVSQDVQARNYFSLFESARLSGIVSHAFFWTLDYASGSAPLNRDGITGPGVPSGGYPISDAYSLVQVQYINGKLTTNYTSAFTMVKNYIASYPQWNRNPGQALTVLGTDALIRVPTVASPGPRDNKRTDFGPTSDNQSYVHLSGSASFSFFNSEGQITSSTSTEDIIRYGTNIASDQDISFRFSTPTASDTFGLLTRVTGTSAKTISAYGCVVQGNRLSLLKIVNGVSTTLLSQPFPRVNGTFYRMRFSVVGSTLTTMKGRIWPEGQLEPTNWTEVIVDMNTPLGQGGFGLYIKSTSSHPLQFDSLMGTSTSSSTSTSLVPRINPLGISPHLEGLCAADADTQLDLMKACGIHWVRQEFVWSTLEPTKGTWNFTTYDHIVAGIQSRGMQMIGLLSQYNVPDWCRGSNPPNQPANATDYAAYVHNVVSHYAGKIPLYEVGNEPNGDGFWYPHADATAYSAMLKVAYLAIKSADSNAKVISAGLSPVEAPEAFLTQMYAAGVAGYMDYIAYHPYSWPASPDFTQWRPTFSELTTFKNIMTNNGDGDKQIIVTEIGWPTHIGGVLEANQASYIQRVYQKILYEDYQYVAIACIYDLLDDGNDTTNPEYNFGILHADLSKKPAYDMLSEVRSEYDAHFTSVQP